MIHVRPRTGVGLSKMCLRAGRRAVRLEGGQSTCGGCYKWNRVVVLRCDKSSAGGVTIRGTSVHGGCNNPTVHMPKETIFGQRPRPEALAGGRIASGEPDQHTAIRPFERIRPDLQERFPSPSSPPSSLEARLGTPMAAAQGGRSSWQRDTAGHWWSSSALEHAVRSDGMKTAVKRIFGQKRLYLRTCVVHTGAGGAYMLASWYACHYVCIQH